MLDIVAPIYNEAQGILKLFDEIKAEIKTRKRVFVMYDLERDTTASVVKTNKDCYPFEIVLVKNNIGRGALNAIKVGMRTATNEMVLVMMADSSDKLYVVDTMCRKMNEGYDLVCGLRYMKGGKQKGDPFKKASFLEQRTHPGIC